MWSLYVKFLCMYVQYMYIHIHEYSDASHMCSVPDQPTNVVATPTLTFGIRVQWEGPQNEADVDGYVIEYKPDATATCDGVSDGEEVVMGAGEREREVKKGLEEGTDYVVRVLAFNFMGRGEFSQPPVTVYTREKGVHDLFRIQFKHEVYRPQNIYRSFSVHGLSQGRVMAFLRMHGKMSLPASPWNIIYESLWIACHNLGIFPYWIVGVMFSRSDWITHMKNISDGPTHLVSAKRPAFNTSPEPIIFLFYPLEYLILMPQYSFMCTLFIPVKKTNTHQSKYMYT